MTCKTCVRQAGINAAEAAHCALHILHCAFMEIVLLSKRTRVFDLKTGVFVLVVRQAQAHHYFSCTAHRVPVPLHLITLLLTLKTNAL